MVLSVAGLALMACGGGSKADVLGDPGLDERSGASIAETAEDQADQGAQEGTSAQQAAVQAAPADDTDPEILFVRIVAAGYLDVLSGSLFQDFSQNLIAFAECLSPAECERRALTLLPSARQYVVRLAEVVDVVPSGHVDPAFDGFVRLIRAFFLTQQPVAADAVAAAEETDPSAAGLVVVQFEESRAPGVIAALLEQLNVVSAAFGNEPADDSFFGRISEIKERLGERDAELRLVNGYLAGQQCETPDACAEAAEELLAAALVWSDVLAVLRLEFESLEPSTEAQRQAQDYLLRSVDLFAESAELLRVGIGGFEVDEEALGASDDAFLEAQRYRQLLAELALSLLESE